jgi:hypothetical protein
MSTGKLADREEAAVREMLLREFNIAARPFQVKIALSLAKHSNGT